MEAKLNDPLFDDNYIPEHGRFNCNGDYIWPSGEGTLKEDMLNKKITITEQSCGGYPMIWEVIINEDIRAYVKYRWGIISLNLITDTCGLFQQSEISEQIGYSFDGILDIDEAIKWLRSKGYEVINSILA